MPSLDLCCRKHWAPFYQKRSRTVKILAKIKVSGISRVVNDSKLIPPDNIFTIQFHLKFFRYYRIESDSATASSSGDSSVPVVPSRNDSNFIRAPSNRAHSLRTSIRGEALRSSLLARQRRQQVLHDNNDKNQQHPETIRTISSSLSTRSPIGKRTRDEP